VGRILAVDWGERRLGLAVSDLLGLTAQPAPPEILKTPEDAAAVIARAVETWDAERVVLGLPLELSGAEGDAAQRVRALAAELATRVAVPIETWDERFTSALAERSLRDEGGRGSGRRRGGGREQAKTQQAAKARVDQRAALLLLQSWLDAHPGSGSGGAGGAGGSLA
jgi:putative Holliday junction resolvase